MIFLLVLECIAILYIKAARNLLDIKGQMSVCLMRDINDHCNTINARSIIKNRICKITISYTSCYEKKILVLWEIESKWKTLQHTKFYFIPLLLFFICFQTNIEKQLSTEYFHFNKNFSIAYFFLLPVIPKCQIKVSTLILVLVIWKVK